MPTPRIVSATAETAEIAAVKSNGLIRFELGIELSRFNIEIAALQFQTLFLKPRLAKLLCQLEPSVHVCLPLLFQFFGRGETHSLVVVAIVAFGGEPLLLDPFEARVRDRANLAKTHCCQ